MRIFNGVLKVGKREHLDLLRKGQVYCNALQFFRELEDREGGMADKNEGATYVTKFNELSIYKNGKYVPVFKNGFMINSCPYYSGNLFCGYFIEMKVCLDSPQILPMNIPEKMLNFNGADSFVVISNIEEFNKRFEKSVESSGEKLYHSLVEYIDFRTYEGVLNPFNKHITFSDQKEIRYYIDRNAISKEDKRVYELGDLSDIIGEVNDLELLRDLVFIPTNKE